MSIWLIILFTLVGLFFLLVVYSYVKMKSMKAVETSSNVIHLNDKNFANVTKTGMVIVDFWAEWCGPCKMIVPTFNEIADEYKGKVRVAKLNVDESRQTAAKFSIRSIPTVIIFKNGKEVKRLVGVKSKSAYLKELNLK